MDHKDNKSKNKKNGLVRSLQSIRRWWRDVCNSKGHHWGSIDSHKLESKIEALRNISDSYR